MTTIAGGLGIYADDANVSNARVSVTTLINEHGHSIATVDRAEFLRAVETELNVKIINRADLPEVGLHTDHGHGFLGPTSVQMATFDYGEQGHTEAVPLGISPDELIALGVALKENEPVDQADVDALADAIAYTTGTTREDQKHLARRLVQAGVRPPKAD